MTERMTSRDIARLAGVSQTTVSRVLQNRLNVSAETRERVLNVLDGEGYVPNQSARAMRTRRTSTIGVVTGRITNPFYPELIDALGTAISHSGMRMVLWASDSEAGEAAAVEAMRGNMVDGVVFTTATTTSSSLYEAMKLGMPTVLAIRSIDEARCDQVTSDNRAGAALAAEHLLRANRKRIAVLAGSAAISTSRERQDGFLSALAQRGVRVPARRIVPCDFSHDAGFAAATTLLDSENPPDSFFCVNDVIALGVLDALKQHGLRVPDDAWVIGYDDIGMAAWPAFDLTTVSQPVQEIADLALELLTARQNDSALPFVHRRFAPRLVVRSSAPLAP